MQVVSRKSLAGLVTAMFALTCVGFGSWGFHRSADRGVNVTLTSATKLQNGETLPAGTYRIEVAKNSQSPMVTFYREDRSSQNWGGKAVASVNVETVTETRKNQRTEIDSVMHGKTQSITRIRPRGWHEELVFGSSGKNTSKS